VVGVFVEVVDEPALSATELLTAFPKGKNLILDIHYLGGKIHTSFKEGSFTSLRYCSYVIVHTSGYPRNPLGPKDPDNAIDAVST